MLPLRPRSPPNERRILTLELDEKPGDPQVSANSIDVLLAATPSLPRSPLKHLVARAIGRMDEGGDNDR
jgi:hypothetical protein